VILTVTPNAALDVTYELARLRLHEASNRVRSVARRAGGKGINVARVLHQLGEEAVVVGFLGGLPGAAAREDLGASGLRDETVSIAAETRLTVFVVEESGEVTGLSEPGPRVQEGEWRALERRCRELLGEAEVMALSGSLPPGAPPDGLRRLVDLARGAGVPAILDSREEWLRHGVEGAPAIVKVNREELEGYAPGLAPLDAAERVRSRGVGAVVVSRAEAGLLAVTADGALEARPPKRVVGNPTGAGDAATAALAAGVKRGTSWPELLAEAVAVSAAAVAHPLAGSFDEAVYRRVRGKVEVREWA
jgi:tagatose 6-phosphate kinase